MNGLDKAGSTPLHWAAHGGHIACLETLLKEPKCEVNVQVCVNIMHACIYASLCVHVCEYLFGIGER